jgi:membrane protein involved in colicin uptake
VTIMQKAAERRLQVRGDVEPLPPEVAEWMPKPVAEASDALEKALERREEAEIAHEIAESEARSAARAQEAAEDEAALAGKPFPAAKNIAAVEALETARRAMHSADRVAAAAVERYLQRLDHHAPEIGEIIGGRMAAVQDRARQHLAEVDRAMVEQIQLDRLSNVLRDPRWTGNQPKARTAWQQPPPDRHVGLQAVSELFGIFGGRQEAIAA